MTALIGSGRTRVLLALLRWEVEHGYPPSYRDLCGVTGLALPSVQRHLYRLRDMGLVSWEFGREKTLHSTLAIVVTKASAA